MSYCKIACASLSDLIDKAFAIQLCKRTKDVPRRCNWGLIYTNKPKGCTTGLIHPDTLSEEHLHLIGNLGLPFDSDTGNLEGVRRGTFEVLLSFEYLA